jgi:hypothetical protein
LLRAKGAPYACCVPKARLTLAACLPMARLLSRLRAKGTS